MKHAFMICLLMARVAFAGSQNPGLMPHGFEQINIGIDWRSLVSLRPKAQIMNMMPNSEDALTPNPETPKSGLVEKLSGGTYDRVIYSFEKGVLVAVMFGKEKGRSASLERANEIRRVGQGRGEPTKIQLTGKQHDQGVISWQEQNLHINVIVPTDEADVKRSVVGLQIMNLKYAERIKAIGVSDDAEEDTELQGADLQRFKKLKSEIKTLLSAKGSNP